jgi:NADPH:quinone reductase-like Zn-dependent oxidoreductase
MTELPIRMTAIGIKSPGGPEVLVPEERPVPLPGASEVLVHVHAAGVNRPDVMQRKGLYPPPPGASDIPGLEIAGEVVAVGDGVSRWKAGAAVTALVTGGGYATYCVAHGDHALPVPAGLSMVQAAALPETVFTVWTNLFDRGGLRRGETALVHGGTSGIGTTAIQLAKALAPPSSSLPAPTRSARPAASSAPMLPSTITRRTSWPRPRPRPTARAPM